MNFRILKELPIDLISFDRSKFLCETIEELKFFIALNEPYDLKLEFKNNKLFLRKEHENFYAAKDIGIRNVMAVVEEIDDIDIFNDFIKSLNISIISLEERISELNRFRYIWMWNTLAFYSPITKSQVDFILNEINELVKNINNRCVDLRITNEPPYALSINNNQIAFKLLRRTGEDSEYGICLTEFWYKIADYKKIKAINGKKMKFLDDYYNQNTINVDL